MSKNGNVPLISGSQYLLLLDEVEQHGDKADAIYYVIMQSPLGKYLINGTSTLTDDMLHELNYYNGITFIGDDSQTKNIYDKFYFNAMECLQ